ncbi:isochorismatase family protein [Microbacterium sp. K24]|uniref:isochorismatase family protein n=1 Tax=Microbacterium sp. K24 TaxID=2305446 RepID=UPI00109D33DD|nr:isochorismatase family protein [Microbacterium sp. K24]
MTTARRSESALLVIDVQNGVFRNAFDREEVIANIARLVDGARDASAAVIWVQDSDVRPVGGLDWQIVPELVPADDEAAVRKEHGDAFEGTELEEILSTADVGHLVVVGGQTDACVRATIHGAFTRGYDVTLVSDAHTTDDRTPQGMPTPRQVIAHTNHYWSFHTAPGRTGRVVPTDEVSWGPIRGD